VTARLKPLNTFETPEMKDVLTWYDEKDGPAGVSSEEISNTIKSDNEKNLPILKKYLPILIQERRVAVLCDHVENKKGSSDLGSSILGVTLTVWCDDEYIDICIAFQVVRDKTDRTTRNTLFEILEPFGLDDAVREKVCLSRFLYFIFFF